MEMEMGMEMDLVDDAMAWCEDEEMSPNTERRRHRERERKVNEVKSDEAKSNERAELEHPCDEQKHEQNGHSRMGMRMNLRMGRRLNHLHVEAIRTAYDKCLR